MRNIQIFIESREGTDDNIYNFTTQNELTEVYSFAECILNYSIQSSQSLSKIILDMNQPLNDSNVLRSGQPVIIFDDGQKVFEGILNCVQYMMLPINDQGQGKQVMIGMLSPSICQLTITPTIFDIDQAKQISKLLDIDVSALLIGNFRQSVKTIKLLEYIITNMDYDRIFKKKILYYDLPEELYIMASAAQSRDEVLRYSMDYYNTVLYQQEDGQIIIRQLDANIECPFDVDTMNFSLGNPNTEEFVPIVPMLQYSYTENAYNTPSIISNYGILPDGVAISSGAKNFAVSYSPNEKFYPRINQLLKTGWFTGQLGNSQINDNIISSPIIASALKNFQINKDQYMNSIIPTGLLKDTFFLAYQAMITGKQMGQALTGYSNFNGTISLDDPNLPKLGNILGSIMQVFNSDMKAGIIASLTRQYGKGGSYLSFSLAPLGSITGYWKN